MEVLPAVKPVLSAIPALLKKVEEIKDDEWAVKRLNITIIEAWKVLDMVVNSQLQGEDIGALENEVKPFAMWCYDVEDLIDKLALKAAKQRDSVLIKIAEGSLQLLHNLFTSGDLHKLQNRLNEISQQLKRIVVKEPGSIATTVCSYTASDSSIPLIGRKDDINKILELLLCDDSIGISIIGTCGLGKSSLARTVYNDDKICGRFPVRLWVHNGDGKFSWENTKKAIDEQLREHELLSASNNHCDKVLIVFDNLQQLGHFEWDTFWSYKKEREKRFKNVRIIITTHKLKISELTFTTPYHLEPLSVKCLEEVIKENAKSYSKTLEESQCFQHTVESTAKKCEGLPLVAKLFGFVIAKCKDEQMIELMKVERLWHTDEFKKEILPKLMPSYIDMDSELRRCAAYFSLFPVGHHFDTDELVQLWVGEYFVQSSEATSSLKRIGKKCIDDLKERSILQPSGACYKLQSFGQDFAMLAALGTCLQIDQGLPSLSSSDENARHLSLSCKDFEPESWSKLENLRKLRTLLSLYTEKDIGNLGKIPPKLYKSLSRLRVLSLKNTNVEELPAFLDGLKHLRYLDISLTPVSHLSSTFCKLLALQFLKLKDSKISHLPVEFHKLTNLRYVDWDREDLGKLNVPCHIGKLSFLESLPLFDIGEKEGYFITELKDMKNLQGSLCINNLQLIADQEEANGAKLHEKNGLEEIVLQWKPLSVRDCALDEKILTSLRPQEYLKELKLTNYGGENLPNWINTSMLVDILLTGCRSCFLPALGKLKSLKTLVLVRIESATHESFRATEKDKNDNVEDVRFRSLVTMKLHDMEKLEECTGLEEWDMPNLCELKFFKCPNVNPLTPLVDILERRKLTSSFPIAIDLKA